MMALAAPAMESSEGYGYAFTAFKTIIDGKYVSDKGRDAGYVAINIVSKDHAEDQCRKEALQDIHRKCNDGSLAAHNS